MTGKAYKARNWSILRHEESKNSDLEQFLNETAVKSKCNSNNPSVFGSKMSLLKNSRIANRNEEVDGNCEDE